MARKFSLLVVLFSVLAVLCLVLSACGGEGDTTTTAGTTTTTPATTTTTPATTTKTPVTTTEPKPLPPVEAALETRKEDAFWVQPHMDYTYTEKYTCVDKVERDVFWFSIKSEGNFFPNTTDEDPIPGVPGLTLTTGLTLYVKDLGTLEDDGLTTNEDGTEADDADDAADYVAYEIDYWYCPNYWEIYFSSDFVPEDTHYYDMYLFLKAAEVGAAYPGAEHFIWNLGTPWYYDAPEPVVSDKLENLDALVARRTRLMYHNEFTVDADGNVHFTFKSDGNPFNNSDPVYKKDENGVEITDELGNKVVETPGVNGVEMTVFGELYIDGEKYDIVADSYYTTQWYIIDFQIKDLDINFVAGQKYEFVFTINPNDPTGNYCNDPDGYFVLYEYIPEEAAV